MSRDSSTPILENSPGVESGSSVRRNDRRMQPDGARRRLGGQTESLCFIRAQLSTDLAGGIFLSVSNNLTELI
jgi:hypothetical protein